MKGKDLHQAIKNSGIPIEEIVDKTAIPKRTLYNLFDKELVEQHYLDKLQKAGIKMPKIAIQETKLVPYYDLDAAGGNNVKVFNEERTEYIKQYLSVPAFSDCDMYINISGNSMYPKYCSGEMVALKRITEMDVVAYGEAYVVVTKDLRLLKYLKKGKDKDHWKLCSENKLEFDDIEMPIKKVLHLYIVKGKITKNII